MKNGFSIFANNIIYFMTAIAAAAAILFFLPTTSEFFEFNKFTVLLVVSIFSIFIWTVKMVLEKRTVFTRTPIDLPIILLVLIFFVSSFSSIDQFVSFFGKHGRIWPSFLPLATLAVLFFTVSANLKTRNQTKIILWVIVLSTLVASLISITSYFGAYLPFEFAQLRSFSTLGSVNNLALLQAIIFPISATWAIFERDKVIRSAATFISLVIFFSFTLINSIPTYPVLIVGMIVLGIGAFKIKLTKSQQGGAALLVVFMVLFLVVRFVPQVASGTLYSWIGDKQQGLTEKQQIDLPKEKTVPNSESWEMAAQALGKRPILGTGPGTFQFIYTQLKPRSINSTDDWALRFEKPVSEFSEMIATTGILGTLAYLLFAITITRFAFTLILKSQNTVVYLPVAGAVIAFVMSSLFVPSSFATTSVFIILLALLAVLTKAAGENFVYEITIELASLKNKFSWLPVNPTNQSLIKTEEGAKGAKSQLLPWILIVVVSIFSFLTLSYQFNAYQADYFYRQSLLSSRSNDGNRTVNFLQKAISANPRVDTYHRALSQTSLNAALNLSRQQDLDDNQRQLLSQLAQVAIDQGKASSGYQILPLKLPGISAANVVNWEGLSSVYQALIGSIGGADVHATTTLTQAVQLDPQNPVLHNRLGQLYLRLGNIDVAKRKFEDAIIVKNDFGPAHYNLANLLIDEEGDVVRIVNELTIAKRVLPAEDPALDDIKEKLDKYNEQLRELQQKAAQNQVTTQEKTTDDEEESGDSSPEPDPSPTVSPSPSPEDDPSPSPSF